MLQVRSIRKIFDGFLAIDNANLDVKKGEIVAVIGPNGAGKTTLFNVITGILKPEDGKVIFKGEDITGLPPFKICRKGISRSFQIVNLFPRLSVFENVQISVLSRMRENLNFFSDAKKMARKETEEILEAVGLQEKRHHESSLLSHGERKALEIAIALGGRPDLLVLDEPTAGMSPEERQKSIAIIKDLSQRFGITILFCEHDMDIVFSIAESIMVMVRGRTIIQDKPEKVRENREVQEAYLGGNYAS